MLTKRDLLRSAALTAITGWIDERLIERGHG
jgi:hypothetical protein